MLNIEGYSIVYSDVERLCVGVDTIYLNKQLEKCPQLVKFFEGVYEKKFELEVVQKINKFWENFINEIAMGEHDTPDQLQLMSKAVNILVVGQLPTYMPYGISRRAVEKSDIGCIITCRTTCQTKKEAQLYGIWDNQELRYVYTYDRKQKNIIQKSIQERRKQEFESGISPRVFKVHRGTTNYNHLGICSVNDSEIVVYDCLRASHPTSQDCVELDSDISVLVPKVEVTPTKIKVGMFALGQFDRRSYFDLSTYVVSSFNSACISKGRWVTTKRRAFNINITLDEAQTELRRFLDVPTINPILNATVSIDHIEGNVAFLSSRRQTTDKHTIAITTQGVVLGQICHNNSIIWIIDTNSYPNESSIVERYRLAHKLASTTSS